jgi:hypothetical protein
MIIISNHNQIYFLHFYFFMYNKLRIFLTHHVHLNPFMCGKKILKIKNSESILESSLNFLSFKIPHILGYEF